MLSGNPTLNEKTFDRTADYGASRDNVMTVQGTVYKSLMLLAIVVAAAAFSWKMALSQSPATMGLLLGGGIGGFVFAIITCFKPAWSPFTAPVYALLEGLFLGAISAFYAISFDGQTVGKGLAIDSIVVQAVGLTMGVAASMFILYAFRIIKVTEKLKAGIFMATGAIMLFYIVSMVLGLFGVPVPLLHSTGPMGIGLSVVICGVAAFNLLIDFDMIERGAEHGAAKYMEWYGAFGLMVTLVWLYLEILRLLSKLRER